MYVSELAARSERLDGDTNRKELSRYDPIHGILFSSEPTLQQWDPFNLRGVSIMLDILPQWRPHCPRWSLLLSVGILLLWLPLSHTTTMKCHNTCICASNIVSCSKMNLTEVPLNIPVYTVGQNGKLNLKGDEEDEEEDQDAEAGSLMKGKRKKSVAESISSVFSDTPMVV
uniref:LRRNT domain-containing protein n=1 Tax=Knipowitschia caucasica TaxID=637954 RepID=A0AAV2LYD9_KNICA